MLRLSTAVAVLTVPFAAACTIDRVEWESTGYAVDEVRQYLIDEHHAENPTVECIQREVEGLLWECRAHTGEEELECRIHFGTRKVVTSLHCEPRHGEEAPPGDH